MSVAEIQAELPHLKTEELQNLWDAIENIMDRKYADEARQRNDFVSWDEYQKMSKSE